MRYSLEWLSSGRGKRAKQKTASLGKCGETGNFVHCSGECQMLFLLWKTIWWFLKNEKNTELPYDPAIPLLNINPEELKAGSERDIVTPKFTGAFFIIAKTWKQPKYLLTEGWISKIWYIHITEYYSALWRKQKYTTTWINLEDIMLSEISQSQKDKLLYGSTYMKYLYE